MAFLNRNPIYNLSAVLRETGLTADVLRAWERRYELPKPQRTPGGHRLYSDYDVATIKWLQSRQTEGLSISRAVELWKEIVARGATRWRAMPQPVDRLCLPVTCRPPDDLRSRLAEGLPGL